MEDFIKYININNFKSIANLELEDCRRINLFIGYPNVGKSNVLEALGLFSLPYLDEGENLNKLVRVENMNELLHNLSDNFCGIETNLEKIELSISSSLKIYREMSNGKVDYIFSKELDLLSRNIACFDCSQDEYCADGGNIMRYIFQSKNHWKSSDYSFLLPPYGENIVSVLARDVLFEERKMNEWIENELKKNNFEYVLDMSDHTIKSQRRLGAGRVRTLPYSSFADTLRRVIFYKTAIASNKNSVLLFEEPEAHAFPPYIKTITQDIIDAKTNQFFIVTHSPFIVNDFLEYADLRKEVAIYLFGFKNDQTTVKRLTDEGIDEVYNYGIDLFFNIESFLRDE
jgi:AAA15 family ATPase/GTPase